MLLTHRAELLTRTHWPTLVFAYYRTQSSSLSRTRKISSTSSKTSPQHLGSPLSPPNTWLSIKLTCDVSPHCICSAGGRAPPPPPPTTPHPPPPHPHTHTHTHMHTHAHALLPLFSLCLFTAPIIITLMTSQWPSSKAISTTSSSSLSICGPMRCPDVLLCFAVTHRHAHSMHAHTHTHKHTHTHTHSSSCLL